MWAAEHLQLGSAVALKFMDPAYASSPAFRARFEREARVAASLKTPHVVHVSDYGIDAAGPFIAMELLQGHDLQTRIEKHRRLSLNEASVLLVQLGKALRRAHEAGLIHRDLKPRNIFLARVDDEEVLKVLDFGIAKDTMGRAVAESTSTGELMGSPHYMSPEQLRADRDLDARSDLWSVGVILYRCLTGRLPFPGDVLGTVMARVLVDPITPATQIAPDLPPGIDPFFARALARDRDQRFQTIRDLVDAFGQVGGNAGFSATASGATMSPFSLSGGSGLYTAQALGIPSSASAPGAPGAPAIPDSGARRPPSSFGSAPQGAAGPGAAPQGAAAHGVAPPSSAPPGAMFRGGASDFGAPPRSSFPSMPPPPPGATPFPAHVDLSAPIPSGTPVGTLTSVGMSGGFEALPDRSRLRKRVFLAGGVLALLTVVIAIVAVSSLSSSEEPAPTSAAQTTPSTPATASAAAPAGPEAPPLPPPPPAESPSAMPSADPSADEAAKAAAEDGERASPKTAKTGKSSGSTSSSTGQKSPPAAAKPGPTKPPVKPNWGF
ncbi:Hypothetical protein CAP_1001 [Chondromyces apiculatus DSM 436]|uniref:non-specific serine/threonine protein kinase n=1 Tax=Chondromyces apiculatus DSM 436 TaxID=1192034 RepID=A0A017SU16_9BACT|nr:Hypothetical protein CAP_1001 [Chondromyces apiculatus DSM 436]